MGHVECDSSGITLHTCLDDSSGYAQSYLKSFLPAYQMVNQSASISSVADRYKVIKFAADASLALTASGSTWSDALTKKLVAITPQGRPSSDLACDDRLLSSLENGADSGTSTSMEEQTLEFDRADFSSGLGAPSRKMLSRQTSAGYPLEQRHGLRSKRKFAMRLVCRAGRRNWCKNIFSSRDANRVAVFRKLALRSKGKSGLFSSFWKPRAVLRKARSLPKVRSTLSHLAKPADCFETEQAFDNGIAALQRLVPGGSDMDAAALLDETADFVMFLRLQVQALQSIANAVEMPGSLSGMFPEP